MPRAKMPESQKARSYGFSLPPYLFNKLRKEALAANRSISSMAQVIFLKHLAKSRKSK